MIHCAEKLLKAKQDMINGVIEKDKKLQASIDDILNAK